MHRFPNFRSHHFLFGSVLALGALSLIPAQADVQYTSVMSIAQDGKFTPMNTSTTWLKDGLERVDSKQSIGPFKSSETTITSAARHNRITFDPALKIYVVDALGTGGAALPSRAIPTSMGAKPAPGAPGTGKMVMTFAVKFLGLEKLMTYQTRHNQTNMTMDSSGCCGTGHTQIKTEDWRADIKLPVFAYPHDSYEGYGGVGAENKCKISFERKGDIAGYDAAQKGLALKTLTFDASGKPLSSMEITMLSFAALKDSDFAPPTDFKKVERAAYDAQKQKAMMAAMMNGAMGGAEAKDDGTEATNGQTPETPATEQTPTEQTPATAPDAGDAGQEAAKGAGKNKLKKKFKLPF